MVIFSLNSTAPAGDEWLSSLRYVKHCQGGTGGVHVFEDPATDNQYTLKLSTSAQHLIDEIVTDAIYIKAGALVPGFVVLDTLPDTLIQQLPNDTYRKQDIYRLAEFIQSNTDTRLSSTHELSIDDTRHQKNLRQTMAKHFACDAWTANHDIISHGKNIIIQNNQSDEEPVHVYRVDNGSTLRQHALGRIRDLNHLSEVEEIDTMRSHDRPLGQLFYGHLNDKDIANQVSELLDRSRDILNTLYELNTTLNIKNGNALLSLYCQRLATLKTRFCPEHPLSFPDYPALPDKTGAGILLYRYTDTNKMEVLLLERTGSERYWDTMAGMSDPDDRHLHTTASRETREESLGILNPVCAELVQHPYIDSIQPRRKTHSYFFRLYLVNGEFDCDLFHQKLRTLTKKEEKEHTSAQWVSIDELNEYKLYPPFQRLLETQEARETLKALKQKQLPPIRLKINSPEVIERQIARQLARKTRLIQRAKAEQNPEVEIINGSCTQSPSERHLELITGKSGADEAIQTMAALTQLQFSDDEIRNFKRLLEIEKHSYQDNLVLYHSCSSEVGFLYHMYSAFMQFLHRKHDTSWVLRLFDTHSRRFPNAYDFAKAHQKNGTVNNYVNQYNASGISCNCFLFGNHKNPSSSSIHLFTSNGNRRIAQPVEQLKQALRKILAVFGMDLNFLTELMRIYDIYKTTQGHLFQLIIPKSTENFEARDLVYAAGCLGSENPLVTATNTLTNPIEIIDHLMSLDDLDDHIAYISALQVRLLARAELHGTMTVHLITKHPTSDALQQSIDALVYRLFSTAKYPLVNTQAYLSKTPPHLLEFQGVLFANALQTSRDNYAEQFKTALPLMSTQHAMEAMTKWGPGDWLTEEVSLDAGKQPAIVHLMRLHDIEMHTLFKRFDAHGHKTSEYLIDLYLNFPNQYITLLQHANTVADFDYFVSIFNHENIAHLINWLFAIIDSQHGRTICIEIFLKNTALDLKSLLNRAGITDQTALIEHLKPNHVDALALNSTEPEVAVFLFLNFTHLTHTRSAEQTRTHLRNTRSHVILHDYIDTFGTDRYLLQVDRSAAVISIMIDSLLLRQSLDETEKQLLINLTNIDRSLEPCKEALSSNTKFDEHTQAAIRQIDQTITRQFLSNQFPGVEEPYHPKWLNLSNDTLRAVSFQRVSIGDFHGYFHRLDVLDNQSKLVDFLSFLTATQLLFVVSNLPDELFLKLMFENTVLASCENQNQSCQLDNIIQQSLKHRQSSYQKIVQALENEIQSQCDQEKTLIYLMIAPTDKIFMLMKKRPDMFYSLFDATKSLIAMAKLSHRRQTELWPCFKRFIITQFQYFQSEQISAEYTRIAHRNRLITHLFHRILPKLNNADAIELLSEICQYNCIMLPLYETNHTIEKITALDDEQCSLTLAFVRQSLSHGFGKKSDVQIKLRLEPCKQARFITDTQLLNNINAFDWEFLWALRQHADDHDKVQFDSAFCQHLTDQTQSLCHSRQQFLIHRHNELPEAACQALQMLILKPDIQWNWDQLSPNDFIIALEQIVPASHVANFITRHHTQCSNPNILASCLFMANKGLEESHIDIEQYNVGVYFLLRYVKGYTPDQIKQTVDRAHSNKSDIIRLINTLIENLRSELGKHKQKTFALYKDRPHMPSSPCKTLHQSIVLLNKLNTDFSCTKHQFERAAYRAALEADPNTTPGHAQVVKK